ncbi:MAG: hypothetical protein JXB50_12065 [Spirochaetes bacterium]|nr:hypothetical protein [Spirochaetota bacterium]
MNVLLDTNIIIHRESQNIINEEIGILFRWLDNLHYKKIIHPVTVEEINKYKNPQVVKTFNIKLNNYNILKTISSFSEELSKLSQKFDKTENDLNDSKLLNELYNNRVDILITEDKNIFKKAKILNLSSKVFNIDSFLEKIIAENPTFIDYKILSIKKEFFGNININDSFFDSFRIDYPEFNKWFNKKADDYAYICYKDNKIIGFLYLKIENENENYSDIEPVFLKKRRLKIGTFKVILNGFKIGERFIKIIFDNALAYKVEEIYVTIFNNNIDQNRLINLLSEFGFIYHGKKNSIAGSEFVYKRNFKKNFIKNNPKITFPFIPTNTNFFLVPIYPGYHTNLLPDSILKTESPENYIENEPFRNAVSKVYISRSLEKNIKSGDVIIFYRTGGFYESVITTVGIIENIIFDIKHEEEFISLCRKRSVFSNKELSDWWNFKPYYRPFIVNFLYNYSFPKRINLKRLIELNIIKDIKSVPRGFQKISFDDFKTIIKETKTDESIIVY